MQDFAGKTAVITGAASGIGLALAHRFAQARMNVVLADIEAEALERAVRSIESRQTRAIGVVTDTRRKQSVDDLAQQANAEFGKVHILCNNAGVASTRSAGKAVWELPEADWRWVMGVNFDGVLYGLQAFVPGMLAHGEEGHIVNTASLAGLMPGGGSYGVSKHGVLALTEGLQADLNSRGAKIQASVLCPGFVNTRIFDAERNRPGELATANTPSPEMQSMMSEVTRNLLAKGKAPEEIADVVFESIEQNRFYILPHPAWDEIVRSRIEQVLARGPVATVDMVKLSTRQAEGEQF